MLGSPILGVRDEMTRNGKAIWDYGCPANLETPRTAKTDQGSWSAAVKSLHVHALSEVDLRSNLWDGIRADQHQCSLII